MNIRKQLFRLNVFGFFACLRLPDAVWVVMLCARGFSLWQVGLAEGIFHITSLLCEIPSGMAADLIGRKRSLMAAGACGMASALMMAFSTSFSGVCMSMVFSALACNFISGSDEALLYDSLLQAGREGDYLSANARYSQIQNLGGMLSNAASLLSGILSYVGFYLLDTVVSLVRVLAACSITEPVVTEDQSLRQSRPFQKLGQRFRVHIQEVAQFLTGHPRVVIAMLADGLIALPGYLTLMFLQQRLSELGVRPMWLGIPVMLISLSRMVGVYVGEHLNSGRLRNFYAVCAVFVGVGTLLAGAAPVVPAILGAMIAAGSMDAWVLHLQRYLNRLFPSDRRATMVSVNMMAYSLLMIGASPVVGWLGDVCAGAGAGLCALGVIVLAAGVGALLRKK